ncbi:MAG TPA: GlsB/YeaQ/YmgE family stress response membrane protein [Aestuariivirgaceae bacterium]|jgi:uncharacterized membrane protein YeaQ/YmgE (transglycosylase-associated protein family)
MDVKNIIIALLIGLVAGWLASLVVGGEGGILRYILTGVIGSFVGSFLLNRFGLSLSIRNEVVRDIITATIGAIIIVLLAKLIA